jgi:dUTP pyrophosphatase
MKQKRLAFLDEHSLDEPVVVPVVKVETEAEPPHECSEIPKMQKVGDACYDLVARYGVYLRPGQTAVIGTGIKVKLPERYMMRIYGRSSLCAKGLVVGAGVIDSGYRDEVKVVLTNASNEPYVVSACDRIAQCRIELLIPTEFVELEEIETLEQFLEGDRGGGFGSTEIVKDDAETEHPLCPRCKYPLRVVKNYSPTIPKCYNCEDCRSYYHMGVKGEVLGRINNNKESLYY